MKILIFMAGFFPGEKYGGPPVSIDNFCTLIGGVDHDVYVVTTDHDLGEKNRYGGIQEGWNDRGNCNALYLNDEDFNKKSFESVIKEIRPELIYLQGLFQKCIIPCLQLCRKYEIVVLLAPRGELCKGAFKKKYKKIPYLLFLKILGYFDDIYIQSTSEEETRQVLRWVNGNPNRIFAVSNVPSLPKLEFERPSKNVSDLKVVFISRIVPKKNLIYALDILKEVEGNIFFDIYGVKEDEKYWNLCEDTINKLPSNIKVCYKGIASHCDIHSIFSQYHMFFFPTFSENYGHVIAEALSVGCYVLTSDQVPWLDMNEYEAGKCLSLDNRDAFICEINRILQLDDLEYAKVRDKCIKYSIAKLNIDNLRNTYNKVFAYMGFN